MEVKIEPARISDLRQIRQYDRHISIDRLQACIESGQVYVIRKTCGELFGVLRYSLFWQSIPFLDLIFLDERFRKQGYGTRMMTYWEDAMRAENDAYVMTSTQEDETAKFFYEKIGYKKIGSFLPPGQEAEELIYLKQL